MNVKYQSFLQIAANHHHTRFENKVKEALGTTKRKRNKYVKQTSDIHWGQRMATFVEMCTSAEFTTMSY